MTKSFIICTLQKIKKDGIGGARSMHTRHEKSVKTWVGKSEGKIPLKIFKRRWDDNIKIDLTEMRWQGMD
jgi:hypothetical protein